MKSFLRALAVVVVTATSTFGQVPPQRAPAQGAAPPPAPGASTAPARGRQGPPPLGPNGTRDPFPDPIPAEEGAIKVNFVEFATLPDVGANAARPMLMSYEAGTRRLFVNDMHGALYSVSLDGRTVTPYLDHRDPRWNIAVQFQNFERGFQSFAFHPDFNRGGAPGYGKIYTYTDTSNVTPPPDWKPANEGAKVAHHAVLLEWTAKNPSGPTYDGEAPRELMRWHRPFVNHNGGQLAFNPTARRGSADYGLLYAGNADGGSGGDPMNMAQNLGSSFGKILRIDPLGRNSTNGKYGIPKDNPFANDNDANTLGEIYAYGARNPQRFAWDSKTGIMYMADIGQGIAEEVHGLDVAEVPAAVGSSDDLDAVLLADRVGETKGTRIGHDRRADVVGPEMSAWRLAPRDLNVHDAFFEGRAREQLLHHRAELRLGPGGADLDRAQGALHAPVMVG